MRTLLLGLVALAVPAAAQPARLPDCGPDDESEVVEDEAPPPDCFEAPPRPPSAAQFVPFPDGARWDFVVERQAFHKSEPGVEFDTIGAESWRVRGTVERGGRAVPLLHVARAGADGAVTDRARCAVLADVEAPDARFWSRWEEAVREGVSADAERSGQGGPPDAPPPGAMNAAQLMGPQELVSLRFESVEGACPELGAFVVADPMAGAIGSLLVGADVYEVPAMGIAAPPAVDGEGHHEQEMWLFAGGVGPYLRARHTEVAGGAVEDRFHRLTHASVGGVVLGRPLAAFSEPSDPPVDSAAEVAIVRAGPNPFRDRLTLKFTVPAPGPVAVELYDALGRRITRADLGDRPAGPVEHVVDGAGLASGVYILRAVGGGAAAVRRVTRVR